MPALAPWQWLLGAWCALAVGMAKTGVPGFGTLVVPLMVLATGDARASAGWLLPLLCAADVFAIVTWRRHAHTRRLFELLPWVLGGMGLGALALGLDERWLRLLVGGIVLAMVLGRFAQMRAAATTTPPADWRHTARYGAVAGFATTVANAAGPVMNVYLLSRRLPKEEFLATGAWFFFVVNLVKVPIYGARGMITGRSLLFDLALVPAVVVGGFIGRTIARRLPQGAFERVVLVLTAAAALMLLVPRG